MMAIRKSSIVMVSSLMTSLLLAGTRAALAASVEATVNSISSAGVGASLGTVNFADSAAGLVITPNRSGLPPG